MPVHDWTRVDRSLFHSFGLGWTSAISGRLNTGILPSDHYALCETVTQGQRAPFLVLEDPDQPWDDPRQPGESRSRLDLPPHVGLRAPCVYPEYAEKVISIRRCDGQQVVAAIRIVTPDTKRRPYRFAAFMDWAVEVIRHDVSLLIVDLFPPKPRDGLDIHRALWEEFVTAKFEPSPDRSLILVSYSRGPEKTAYVEPVAVGHVLPEMPIFLDPELYVPVPLEATYQAEWGAFPAVLKGRLESPQA